MINPALSAASRDLLVWLGQLDPAPLFSLSLLPYLAFLWWAQRSGRVPRLALVGFQMTLVFVAVTIVAAVVAEQRYGKQLADVDWLHGGAESLLTVSNLLVLLGFRELKRPSGAKGEPNEQVLSKLGEDGPGSEDGASVSVP